MRYGIACSRIGPANVSCLTAYLRPCRGCSDEDLWIARKTSAPELRNINCSITIEQR